MTLSVGRQVRFIKASTGSVVVGNVGPPSAPHDQGKRFHTSSPSSAAVAWACSKREAGMAQWKLSGNKRPVRLSSSLSSTWRMTRKVLGTRPLASPECTPSVSTSTFKTPLTMPRKLVVNHSWS